MQRGGEIDNTILVRPRHASREDIKDLYDEVEENMYEYKTFKAPNNEADYISITPDNFSERNRITEYLDNESWEYEEYARGGKTNWVQDVVDSPNFREGAFTRKAEARGMSTDAFMNQVLHSPNLYDERTRKQAQFMKNAFND